MNIKSKLLLYIQEENIRPIDIFKRIMINGNGGISYSTLWNTIHNYNNHKTTHKTKVAISTALDVGIDMIF